MNAPLMAPCENCGVQPRERETHVCRPWLTGVIVDAWEAMSYVEQAAYLDSLSREQASALLAAHERRVRAAFMPGTRVREISTGDLGIVTRVTRTGSHPSIWALWDATRREEFAAASDVEVVR